MKKFLKYLMVLFVFTFSLVACGDNTSASQSVNNTQSSAVQPVEKHTVQFYVEDTLYKTMKIANDTVIGKENVEDPIKEKFTFVQTAHERGRLLTKLGKYDIIKLQIVLTAIVFARKYRAYI